MPDPSRNTLVVLLVGRAFALIGDDRGRRSMPEPGLRVGAIELVGDDGPSVEIDVIAPPCLLPALPCILDVPPQRPLDPD